MAAETLSARNQRRHEVLDRYRGAFLGLALADPAAARAVLDRCDVLLGENEADLLALEWPDAAVLGALAALWHGEDWQAVERLIARQAGARAQAAAAAMAALLAGGAPDALPPMGEAVRAIRGATTFAEGLAGVPRREAAFYGLLAGAWFGEEGLGDEAVSWLPMRAVARAVAGAIFERVWAPAPPDAPEIVCEHCRALIDRGAHLHSPPNE